MAQRPLSRAQFSSNKLPASHPCPVLRTPPNLLPQLHTQQGAPLNSQPGPSGATPPLCPSSFCPPASGLSPPPDSVFSPAVLNSFRNVSQPQLWLDGSKQDRRAGKMDPVFIIKNVDFFPSRILWALTSILKKYIYCRRDFPGGPGDFVLSLHWRIGFSPWSGNKIPQTEGHGQKEKKCIKI